MVLFNGKVFSSFLAPITALTTAVLNRGDDFPQFLCYFTSPNYLLAHILFDRTINPYLYLFDRLICYDDGALKEACVM
ncbi:hypothetical protein Sjap_025575 [Stephania japonica]|uniref:Uncharacterized protein n=1 Tax=Stephania japonica TaxID=461633 RepID=A0AAP0E9T2_9MAGN